VVVVVSAVAVVVKLLPEAPLFQPEPMRLQLVRRDFVVQDPETDREEMVGRVHLMVRLQLAAAEAVDGRRPLCLRLVDLEHQAVEEAKPVRPLVQAARQPLVLPEGPGLLLEVPKVLLVVEAAALAVRDQMEAALKKPTALEAMVELASQAQSLEQQQYMVQEEVVVGGQQAAKVDRAAWVGRVVILPRSFTKHLRLAAQIPAQEEAVGSETINCQAKER
jgi:hypothetical protein